MALSSIIKNNCKICGKPQVEKSRISLGTSKLISLECGHVTTEEIIQSVDYESFIWNSNGRVNSFRPFQVAGMRFCEEANARVLIADEQGLGKTIQTNGLLKFHPELLPALIVTKTTVKNQFHHEIIDMCGVEGYLCQVIGSSKEKAMPAFDIFITSYDLLKTENMFEYVEIRTLVLDECQAIKNHLSDRAKASQKIAKKAKHIIGLSGTPIKNNAGEYFTILNILQPGRFPSYRGFLDTHCDSYSNGYGDKIGGLRRPEYFHSLTKDFIIRRTKDEVLSELPSLSRNFFHVELDRKLNKRYAALMAELEELFYSEDADIAAKIAIMTKMRQITGISKVENCVDFVTEHLLNTDKKITIFVHHHDVATLLQASLDDWLKDGNFSRCLNLTASLSGDARADMVRRFKEDDSNRVMIASTLSAGEGLNLQFCSDAIMLERQWNPANEEQAEGRFHRFGQEQPVTITYMLASETIDEYFTEIVERKRAIVASTLDNKEIKWEQSNLMQELASVLVTKGKKKWSL